MSYPQMNADGRRWKGKCYDGEIGDERWKE